MPTLAKLTRPKMHRAVPRERLFERMDEARERPLVWVVAPPGSGKTTLAASYIEARRLRSVWYQVDAGDDDIGTFFYYLAQTAPPPRSKRDEALPLLTPEHRSDLPGYSRRFFRTFFSRLNTPTALVLDNYHELPAGAPLHAVMGTAVAEAPEGVNIVAISRAEPPSELLPLKLNERLATIDWSLLRMTLDETRAIAERRMELDDPTVQRIHSLADGWAAGIALTLQRVHQERDRPAPEHEAREEMFDYFAAQILKSSTQQTQQFLMRTALLPAMTATMADRLCERDDSEALLDDLYRRGVFIGRRNTRPLVYHYHDLFRAFLLARLEQTVSGNEFLNLQRSAAALLEDANQNDHAIRLYLKAGEWSAAKRLIFSIAPQFLAQGRGSSIKEWLSALPRELADEDPWVDYWFGATLARVAPVDARTFFIRAFYAVAHRGEVAAQRLLCAEIIFTYMHEFADLTPMDRWTAAMLRLLDDPQPFRSPAAELHVRTACLFALGFRQPEPGALEHCVARVTNLLAGGDIPPELAAIAAGILIMHLYVMADLNACARVAARFRTALETDELSPVSRALGSMQLGHAAMRWGDRAEAIQLYNRALDLGAKHAVPLPTLYVYSHLGLAFCAIERGDLAQAEIHRKKVEEHWVPSRKIDGAASMRMQMWIACQRRQWNIALPFAQRHLAIAHESGVFMLRFESHVLLATIYAEMNQAAECEQALLPVRSLLAGTAYAHFVYQVDLVEAYAALQKGVMTICREKLRSGLASSKQDQGMFALRMQAGVLPRLVAEALAAGIETDYAAQLIRRFDLRPPASAPANWPWPLKILTLGNFEVLRDDKPLEFSRKAPKKTLALLKAIIAFGGKNVREQLLLDAFWSDEEGDVAARSLTAALHRLRGLIGDNEAILQQGGILSLNTARVWVDAWAFEERLGRGDDDSLKLYRGGFLVEDEGEPWAVAMRERLRSKFIHALSGYARALEATQRFEAAVDWYLRGLDADPVIEQFYQGLMRCYIQLDRKSEAAAAYRRLKQILSVSLSLKPSPATEKLYQSLRLDPSQR